jgi:hypothetical protein
MRTASFGRVHILPRAHPPSGSGLPRFCPQSMPMPKAKRHSLGLPRWHRNSTRRCSWCMLSLDSSRRAKGYYSKEYHNQVLTVAKRKMGELQRAAGTHAEVIIGAGSIAHVVCKTADDLKADLLVIGAGVNAASGRLGLNTYGIIRESLCPVVSV